MVQLGRLATASAGQDHRHQSGRFSPGGTVIPVPNVVYCDSRTSHHINPDIVSHPTRTPSPRLQLPHHFTTTNQDSLLYSSRIANAARLATDPTKQSQAPNSASLSLPRADHKQLALGAATNDFACEARPYTKLTESKRPGW